MKLSTITLIGIIALFSQGCEKPDCNCSGQPLSSNLVGRWEWVKTVTPSRVLTPELSNYKEDFSYGNDGVKGDYVTFYRNDSLYFKAYKDREYVNEDLEKKTVLFHIGSKYQKYYLKKGSDNVYREVELSQLMDSYSNEADTIRSLYKLVGAPKQ